MMFNELETIRNAAQMLSARDPEKTDELLQASERIWSRIYNVDKWPELLEARARVLSEKLTANGDIAATVEAMDEAESAAVEREIVEFAAEVREAQKVLV